MRIRSMKLDLQPAYSRIRKRISNKDKDEIVKISVIGDRGDENNLFLTHFLSYSSPLLRIF